MRKIRPPAVAGTFYPANPRQLQAMVHEYLDTASPQAVSYSGPTPKAIIAPHAGYIYSGPIAGSAFRPLQGKMDGISRVILLGPAHTMPVTGLAATSAAAFATPLGEVMVDEAAMEIIRPLPQVHILDAAHAQEHSLEVELPFLQTIATHFTIVPLVVGQASGADVAELLGRLWGGPETLIVISSDLSHYEDYETARKMDGETAVAIETLQPQKLNRESACGRIPIQGLLLCAQAKGLTAQTIDLRNSGDTAGSKDRVVGYGAFVFGG